MKIAFGAIGLWFDADIDFTEGHPGQLSGPPDRCSPPEDDEIDFVSLQCGEHDAMFLVDQECHVYEEIWDKARQAAHDEIQRQNEARYDD